MKDISEQASLIWNLLNQLDTMLFISDIDTCQILFMSDKMKEEFECKEDIVGQVCHDLLEGRRGKNCKQCYVEKVVDEHFFNCTWEEYNGEKEKYYRNVDSFIPWVDGKMVHLRKIFDITEERLLNHTLKEVKKNLEKAEHAKRDFLGRMKRNIGMPIHTIIGLSKVAMEADERGKVQECLEKIEMESKKLSDSIGNVFDLAKIESDQLQFMDEPFRFENMLIGVSNEITKRCEEKNQIFQIRMDMEMSAYFVGDEVRIMQVLNNLLNNAVKFTPEGGKIQVEVHQVELVHNISTIEISVSDTGKGMPLKQQNNIIALFEEQDLEKMIQYEGIGLGLPICKSIVNKMGGELHVYSNENIGTTFTFTLKLEVFESRHFDRKLFPGTNIQNLNVLYMDNGFEVCEYARKIMSGFKVNSDTTTTYVGLMDKIKEAASQSNPYHIVFLDSETKNLNITEAVASIKEHFQQTTVVLTTTKQVEKKRLLDEGADKVIVKPLFPSLVLDVINEIVIVPSKNAVIYKNKNYNFDGKRILLVEDVKINQEIITKVLKDTKVKLYYADNGQVALEMMRQNSDSFDLILMDVHMPELNGMEATQQIRKLDALSAKTMPIIALTANSYEEDIQACIASGMNDHVAKPIDIDHLLETLQKYFPRKNKVEHKIDIEHYINVQEAMYRVRGNTKVYKALLGNFIKNTKFDLLKSQIEKGEFERAFRTAHAIKGAAANLSLVEVYSHMAILENELLDGQSTEGSMIEAEIVLEQTIQSVKLYLAS